MGKLIQMLGVLIGISLVSGLVLGAVNALTKDRIKRNELELRKIPAVIQIVEGLEGRLDAAAKKALNEELLTSFQELAIEGLDEPLQLFIYKREGRPVMVAIEGMGEGGYSGDVGVMVGFDLSTEKLAGVGITTHSETPGLGDRVTEEWFRAQFMGLDLGAAFRTRRDSPPGVIDGISGATKSSQAVANGAGKAVELFKAHRAKILDQVGE